MTLPVPKDDIVLSVKGHPIETYLLLVVPRFATTSVATGPRKKRQERSRSQNYVPNPDEIKRQARKWFKKPA